jgi:hypothetical protein
VVFRGVDVASAAAPAFRLTLVWSDYPATPLASVSLVNDLDLTCTRVATGTVLRPNGLAAADRVNNVERIVVARSPTIPTSDVFCTVKAHLISALGHRNAQPFALVATGHWTRVDVS